jgi:hypothetical protein
MAITRYLSAWAGLLGGLALAACGGGDGQEPAQGPEDAPVPSEELPDPMLPEDGMPGTSLLSVSMEGALSVTSGVAQLKVRDDAELASLVISGNSEQGDNFYITLVFPFAAVIGAHTSELGLPRAGDNFAHVYFGASGEYQYSRSGSVQVTLSPENLIEGTFVLNVSPANDNGRTFEVIGDVITDVGGTFSGSYETLCYSSLPGHAISVAPDREACAARGL